MGSDQISFTMRFIAIFITIILTQATYSMKCGRYTTKTLKIGTNTKSVFETQRQTKRCTVLYKLTGGCNQMKMWCNSFFVPNKDDFRCRRGDKFWVKSSGSKPRVFCNKGKPTQEFPAYSNGNLKVWYQAKQSKQYPNKGATCIVTCDNKFFKSSDIFYLCKPSTPLKPF